MEAHFHEEDRIREAALIPNAVVLSALPASAPEGTRTVVKSGSTYTFYQFLEGAWRTVGPTALSNIPTRVCDYPNIQVANTVVATNLYAANIAANSMGTDGGFKLIIKGEYKNTTTIGQVLTFPITWGGGGTNTSLTFGVTNAAGLYQFELTITILNKGATNAQFVYIQYDQGAIGGGSSGNFWVPPYSGAEDTTGTPALTVQAQWGTADVGAIVYAYHTIFETVPSS